MRWASRRFYFSSATPAKVSRFEQNLSAQHIQILARLASGAPVMLEKVKNFNRNRSLIERFQEQQSFRSVLLNAVYTVFTCKYTLFVNRTIIRAKVALENLKKFEKFPFSTFSPAILMQKKLELSTCYCGWLWTAARHKSHTQRQMFGTQLV